MAERYKPAEIAAKWQQIWAEQGLDTTAEDANQPKFYALSMLPYLSGHLHVGHVRNSVITDAIARVRRRQGYRVLHPMGWDAFGLPAERAAITHRCHPAEWINQNVVQMRAQLEQLGLSYDWQRELTTCSPDYYRWTQWIFIQLFEMELAYPQPSTVNWDPTEQIGLANEQVDCEGRSRRSGAKVERQLLRQWFLRMTDYADELRQDLAQRPSWPEPVCRIQQNWSRYLPNWLISRQRFWGVPIPVVHCANCGLVPVPEAQLPVVLPETVKFGRQELAPLTKFETWRQVPCPTCGLSAERETATLDSFLDSSWYFLRFADASNDTAVFAPAQVAKWLPVDLYVTTLDQTALHLGYARFLTKALRDRGLLTFDEPFDYLLTVGPVQNVTYRHPETRQYLSAADIADPQNPTDPQSGLPLTVTDETMSPAKANTVSPQTVVDDYGADALRLFLLFNAPPEQPLQWCEDDLARQHEFLQQVWQLVMNFISDATAADGGAGGPGNDYSEADLRRVRQTAIATIHQNCEEPYSLNMVGAALMTLTQALQAATSLSSPTDVESIHLLVTLLAPFAPHIAEELWHRLGHAASVHQQAWPPSLPPDSQNSSP